MKRHLGYISYIIIFLTLSGSFTSAFAQNRYLHMTGLKGNNDPITADLTISGNRVEGFYNNANQGQRISIAIYGELQPDGSIVMNDKASEQLIFTGKLSGGNQISGMWETNDSEKKYPFSLKEEYTGGSIPYKLYAYRSKTSLAPAKDSPMALFESSIILPPDTMNRKVTLVLNNVLYARFFGSDKVQDPQTIFNDLESRYFNQYKTNNTDINTAENYQFLNWEKRKNMQVMFNENYITTLQFSDYAYTGGSFGLNITKYLVFDVRTGKDIKLAEIFAPGFYDKLGLLITNRIKESLKIDDKDALSSYGYFKDKVEPTENFYINNSGIGFHYNSYEIAGLEAGPQDIFIPFADLKQMLAAQHPFSWLR